MSQPRRPRRGQARAPANTIAAETADAPAPQRMDTRALQARSASPDLLTPDELEERQRALGETRRPPGPPLRPPRGGRTRAAAEPADAMPPTDCADPPR